MTVYDFCSLYAYNWAKLQIFSTETENIIFEGTFEDARKCEFSNKMIGSFEVITWDNADDCVIYIIVD